MTQSTPIHYTLRPYQQQAVDATVKHFRQSDESAVIVLPTGSGKSLVISELARLANHPILVLAHVKELVEQNHAKYESYGLSANIYSAGLGRKETQHQVTFASVQSVSPNLADFKQHFSLIIVDECHRIGKVDDSRVDQNQYQTIIRHLQSINPKLKLLGLTATPYRMGSGWIYRDHYHGFTRGHDDAVFKHCIFDMPLGLMIKQGFLSKPTLIDAAIAHYDFSTVTASTHGNYPEQAVNSLLTRYKRVTKAIIEQVVSLGTTRQGVMVFAATTKHAQEIMGYLAEHVGEQAIALILGETANSERDEIIRQFKNRQIKYLVNVAVLTTGFDAPHVDLIALLRPTQSVSLFQQIVGRGLRLCDGKDDCLIIDYASSGFDLYSPEVGSAKPNSDSVPVMVPCPQCQFGNTFWGQVDNDGDIIEHFGRRCMGFEDIDGVRVRCDYRYRFKECGQCGAENDIAARNCQQCQHAIIDPDDLLKKSLKLKDAMIIRCQGMSLTVDEQSPEKVKITYHDEDGNTLSEFFDFSKKGAIVAFNNQFSKRVNNGVTPTSFTSSQQALSLAAQLTHPDFIIARKQKYFWKIQEKIFDYQGNYRKANQL
jgi:DNA repair protein RadD